MIDIDVFSYKGYVFRLSYDQGKLFAFHNVDMSAKTAGQSITVAPTLNDTDLGRLTDQIKKWIDNQPTWVEAIYIYWQRDNGISIKKAQVNKAMQGTTTLQYRYKFSTTVGPVQQRDAPKGWQLPVSFFSDNDGIMLVAWDAKIWDRLEGYNGLINSVSRQVAEGLFDQPGNFSKLMDGIWSAKRASMSAEFSPYSGDTAAFGKRFA